MRYPYDVGRRLTRPDPADELAGPAPVRLQAFATAPPPEATGVQRAERLRSQLNGARVVAPLYRAVLAWPGLNAPREVFEEAFDEVTRLCHTTRDLVKARIEPHSDHPATRALLARPIAELVACAWELVHLEDAGREALAAERLAALYLGTLEMSAPTPEQLFADVPRATEEKLVEGRAVSAAVAGLLQVWALPPSTQRLYVGDRTREALIADIRDAVVDAADEVGDQLGAHLPDHQRSTVYRSALGALSELYRATLDAEFQALSGEIRGMDSRARQTYLASLGEHPGGVLMERTAQVFAALAPSCYPEDVALAPQPQLARGP